MLGNALVGGILVVFAGVISLISLKHFTAPYLWIALTWLGVLLCAQVLVPRARAAWLGLAIVVSVLAGLEVFSWVSGVWVFRDIKKSGTFEWVADDVVGYKGRKNAAQTETKYYRGEKLYEVVYTMDANGWRVTSNDARGAKGNKPCVLFFGGSYAFGWGLNDQDTLPYRVQAQSAGRFDVYNLSFMTHGPHQMLAALEQGLVSASVNCKPQEVKHVIYETVPTDVRRAAGLQDGIDLHHAPQYVLKADGEVAYRGIFGQDNSRTEKIRRQLSKSYFARILAGGDAIHYRRYHNDDVVLYLAILDSAKKRMKALYPDSDFHVLVWENDGLDHDSTLARQLVKGLGDKGFSFHRVSDIIPDLSQHETDYLFGGYDLHPNAAANNRIADYLVRNALRR